MAENTSVENTNTETTTTENKTETQSTGAIEWDKVLFDDKGKIVEGAYKHIEPLISKKVNDGIKTWQENNLSKYVSKEDYDKISAESKAITEKMTIDLEITKKIANAKYPDLIMAQIKRDNVKITENGILGLEQEIERVKTAYPDLFTTTAKPTNIGGTGNKGEGKPALTMEDVAKMSPDEVNARWEEIKQIK